MELSILLQVDLEARKMLEELLQETPFAEAKFFTPEFAREKKKKRFDLLISDLAGGLSSLEHLLDEYQVEAVLYLGDKEELALDLFSKGVHEYLPIYDLTSSLLTRLFHFALARGKAWTHLKESSFTDDLTGLYNRRGFRALTEHAMRVAKRTRISFLLFMLDIDFFKKINDLYGHAEGDRMIAEVANCLSHSFRAHDIVGRIGGDEFAILAYANAKEVEEHLKHNLQNNLSKIISKEGKPIHCSLAAAFYQGEPITLEELFTQADAALYQEKRAYHSTLDGRDERM